MCEVRAFWNIYKNTIDLKKLKTLDFFKPDNLELAYRELSSLGLKASRNGEK